MHKILITIARRRLSLCFLSVSAHATSITLPYSFTAGSPISASQMMGNFSSITSAISSTVSSPWVTSSSNIYFNTGSVGIGSSAPAYAMDVSGSVNATSMLINKSPVIDTNANIFGGRVQATTGFGTAYYASSGSSIQFLCQNVAFYRVSVYATNASTSGGIGIYNFIGLNKNGGGGPNPIVLTLATVGTISWSFAYAASGANDTTVTVNTTTAYDQGTRVIVERLY